jgi:Protein of unknown function (DUF2568)
MNAVATLNLLVRFLLELAALAALAWWGADAGHDVLASALLGAGLPLAAATLWTLFVAPRRRHELPRAARFVLQVLVLGGAAAALVAADHPVLGIALAAAAALNGALLLALAGRSNVFPAA